MNGAGVWRKNGKFSARIITSYISHRFLHGAAKTCAMCTSYRRVLFSCRNCFEEFPSMLNSSLHKLTNDGRKWSSFEGKENHKKRY